MKYNLPFPNVLVRSHYSHSPSLGEIYAFEYNCRTGILVAEDEKKYYLAVNLYGEKGNISTFGLLPDDIIIYDASEEEKQWAREACFLLLSQEHATSNRSQVGEFIHKYCHNYSTQSFCREHLCALPWFQLVKDDKNFLQAAKREALKEITDIGLQYDREKVEMYCFLIGVLMISENREKNDAKRLLEQFINNWYQFSWMYGMILGRVMGCSLANFTSMLNSVVNSRKQYIHLYLPLVENNIDKIMKYSTLDKAYKLNNAIAKMKIEEERNEQKDDLDKLYSIVFPRNFKKAMSTNLPSATIKEMKEELEKKNEQVNHWKKTAEQLLTELNNITSSMEKQVCDSLSMEEVSTAILSMKTEVGRLVFSNLDFKLRKNEVWQKGRMNLLDKLEEKEKRETVSACGSMNDNHGIVAGGNVNANLMLTDHQVEILISQLSLTSAQRQKLIDLKEQ